MQDSKLLPILRQLPKALSLLPSAEVTSAYARVATSQTDELDQKRRDSKDKINALLWRNGETSEIEDCQ